MIPPFEGISGEQNHADKAILVLCTATIVWPKKKPISNKYKLRKPHLFVYTLAKPHTITLVDSIPISQTLLGRTLIETELNGTKTSFIFYGLMCIVHPSNSEYFNGTAAALNDSLLISFIFHFSLFVNS